MSDLDFQAMRRAMVVSQLRTNAVNDPRVTAAIEAVAREDFVPAERRAVAYVDRAVPLSGARALNPTLVTARLIVEAGIGADDKVLIVGAASGYAAAVVAGLAASVVALESDADAMENDMGRKGLEAGLGDEEPLRKISTLDDLLWLMGEDE